MPLLQSELDDGALLRLARRDCEPARAARASRSPQPVSRAAAWRASQVLTEGAILDASCSSASRLAACAATASTSRCSTSRIATSSRRCWPPANAAWRCASSSIPTRMRSATSKYGIPNRSVASELVAASDGADQGPLVSHPWRAVPHQVRDGLRPRTNSGSRSAPRISRAATSTTTTSKRTCRRVCRGARSRQQDRHLVRHAVEQPRPAGSNTRRISATTPIRRRARTGSIA